MTLRTWTNIRGFIYLILILWFMLAASCSPRYCQPSKRSRDYATVMKIVPMQAGYVHVVADDSGQRYDAYYECLPDTVRVGSVVWVGNYRKLKTGAGHRVKLPGVKGSNNNNYKK